MLQPVAGDIPEELSYGKAMWMDDVPYFPRPPKRLIRGGDH